MADNERGEPLSVGSVDADGGDQLAASLSQFARELEEQDDAAATLEEVVRASIALIPGCDEASISVIANKRVASEAASGEMARAVDELQDLLAEGPCHTCAQDGVTVRAADLANETRWPRFSGPAREAGVAGMMCFHLFVHHDNLGALNLFSRTPHALDDESEYVGLILAAHAAVAFGASRNDAAADRKMAVGQLIGQAQGILMERHRLTADQALTRLVRVSQRRNVKLRDVAGGLVHSGQIEDPGTGAQTA